MAPTSLIIASTVLTTLAKSLTWNEALSGVFGSISLATWIFLLVPQLILNYTSGSADGISIAFLTVWLVGDITNLAGALWAGLVPTVIALAIYFCIADFVLISQCLYYNKLNSRRDALSRHNSLAQSTNLHPTPAEHHEQSSHPNPHPTYADVAAARPKGHAVSHTNGSANHDETSPLLRQQRSHDSLGLPGSHTRRRSSRPSNASEHRDTLQKILEEDGPQTSSGWKKNVVSIVGIIVIGTAGWVLAWQSGVWSPQKPEGSHPSIGDGGNFEEPKQIAWGASALGYFSAICYLGARIPQIMKNYRDKSCEGLALLFFVLSLMGNITYGAGILFHSLETRYLMNNLPWLIGSLGTMVEDAVIFVQFRMYSGNGQDAAV